MKRSCVIFACTILSNDRLHVLHDFLESFKKDYLDCDFYVGINPGSVNSTEALIQSSGLVIKGIGRVSESLYNFSDASAYQLALNYASQSTTNYNVYWFVHTKGGVNSHSDYLRKWYINNYLSDRVEVENFLHRYAGIGSYGMLGLAYDPLNPPNQHDTIIPLFENRLTAELPFTHANFFYIHTLYAIKGLIVNKFFNLITKDWFTTKLDRYYFEGIFPFIVSRLGYFPYVANGLDVDKKSIQELNKSWIIDNNLLCYMDCLSLHKTNYSFDQLYPPYK